MPMIRRIAGIVALGGVLVGESLWAAPAPLHILDAPVLAPPDIPPQIDATAVLNRTSFDVTDTGTPFFNPLPYQILNNRFFTNDTSGIMACTPGFRFDYFTGNVRRWMNTWVNQGTVRARSGGTVFSQFGTLQAASAFLLVAATNLISSGDLSVDSGGLLRLQGRGVDISRISMRQGNPPGVFQGGGFEFFVTNFLADVGVTDAYWGGGTNNRMAMPGPAVFLPGLNFTSGTPFHEAASRVFGNTFTTNLYRLPLTRFAIASPQFEPHVFTTTLDASNRLVQIVFVPTNNLIDSNFSTDVRFFRFFDNEPATVGVRFTSRDFDFLDETETRDTVYVIDSLAVDRSVFFLRNFFDGTRRPSTLSITRALPFGAIPFGGDFDSGFLRNSDWTSTLIYNTNYASNTVTMTYAAYAADINGSNTFSFGGAQRVDPTNLAGRVEIFADRANFEETRIRAESTIVVHAKDIAGNFTAQMDAPFLVTDIASTQPQLVLENLFSPTTHGLSGRAAAWSALWQVGELVPDGTSTNFLTNTITFHVLVCDHLLNSRQPVVMDLLKLKATNLVVRDPIMLSRAPVIDARAFCLDGALLTSPGSLWNWANSNAADIVSFTNNGIIRLAGAAAYGTDRTAPYSNWVNRGTNTATGQAIRSRYVENRGWVRSEGGGAISMIAQTANFLGRPNVITTNVVTNVTTVFFPVFRMVTNVATNVFAISAGARMSSSGVIDLRANDMVVSNSWFESGLSNPAPILISVTNRLVDAGQGAINLWMTRGGVEMRRRPTTSDLMATYVDSIIPGRGSALHTWAAQDRGANNNGFSNNLALGRLRLDGGSNSLFRFAGASAGRLAMYVDYLEVANAATNILTNASRTVSIDPNFTVYFAHANVGAAKLEEATRGRFKWVRTFTGPLSSTNITYTNLFDGSVTTHTFNTSLVLDKDLDSDGDGIVNPDDPTPILTGETVNLSVTITNVPPPAKALLAWYGPTNSISYVEYKPAVTSNWSRLTAITNRSLSRTLTYCDPSPMAAMRIYRVRVDQFLP